MSIVLVTKRMYLICEDVTSITLQENGRLYEDDIHKSEYKPPRKTKGKKRKPTAKKPPEPKNFTVEVIYNTVRSKAGNSNYGNGPEEGSLSVQIRGEEQARQLFKELVAQIREQKPDVLFINKVFEDVFGEVPSDDELEVVNHVEAK